MKYIILQLLSMIYKIYPQDPPLYPTGEIDVATLDFLQSPYGPKEQLVRASNLAFAPTIIGRRFEIANRLMDTENARFVSNMHPLNLFRGPNILTNPEMYSKPEPQADKQYYSNNVDDKITIASEDFINSIGKMPNFQESAEIVPTFVPSQQGPLPTKDEIKDNKQKTNLAEVGRAIGNPLRHQYEQSPIGVSQRWVGSTVNYFEQVATAPVTPELIDFIEVEPLIRLVESADDAFIVPYVYFHKSDPIVRLARNITEIIVWQNLDYVDPNSSLGNTRNEQQDKLKAAATCAIAANALPNCPTTPEVPPPPPEPSAPIFLPITYTDDGYLECALVSGMDSECPCLAGTNLNAEEFNGYYKIIGLKKDLDQDWPVYGKNANFDNFASSEVLFLTRTIKYGNTSELPIKGSWASNTPTTPNFESARRGGRPPFGATLGLLPPGNCTNTEPKEFPVCASGDKWVVCRSSDSCAYPGLDVQGVCIFSQPKVEIKATGCPPGYTVYIPPESYEAFVYTY
eukprot:GHVR01139053.1.p1 GENE.GHVR01139053.1~~GHVR01139053.1.p1  ORF type:complete len:514 (-),score=94.66 GHVR01139053.1:144-1685(-)